MVATLITLFIGIIIGGVIAEYGIKNVWAWLAAAGAWVAANFDGVWRTVSGWFGG